MVATRAQLAAAAAARPAARLDGLPVDLLAHIALYAGHRRKRHESVLSKSGLFDLLVLRGACRACVPAVRRAATDHALLELVCFREHGSRTVGPNTVEPCAEAIEAWGYVFGSGCRELRIRTSHVGHYSPADLLPAFRSFVISTQGRLCVLRLPDMPFYKGRDFVLEMCRASPQLKELYLHLSVGDTITSRFTSEDMEDIDEFCIQLSGLCPLLGNVKLCGRGWYPFFGIRAAESYSKYFPNTKCLVFTGSRASREPSRYAAIEETVRACARADEVDLSECIVRPTLVDMLLRTPLRGRLKKMYFGSHAEISPQTILQCARGFELLTHLTLPELFSAGPEFYRNLVQARPTLNSLALSCECDADDACLRIICDGLSLEHLTLSVMDNLSEALIDIILQSRSAQTLRGVTFYDTLFVTLENMLRFARGCPLLVEAEWHAMDHDLDDTEHRSNIDAIDRLLKSRGGKGMEVL